MGQPKPRNKNMVYSHIVNTSYKLKNNHATVHCPKSLSNKEGTGWVGKRGNA